MSNEEDRVPGVTLWFKSSSIGKPGGPTEQYRVHLQLDAVVTSEALWQAIEQRLKDGLRIYTQLDFHEEVISVMGKKSRDLVGRIAQLEKDLATERLARQKAELDVEKYKTPLQEFVDIMEGRR